MGQRVHRLEKGFRPCSVICLVGERNRSVDRAVAHHAALGGPGNLAKCAGVGGHLGGLVAGIGTVQRQGVSTPWWGWRHGRMTVADNAAIAPYVAVVGACAEPYIWRPCRRYDTMPSCGVSTRGRQRGKPGKVALTAVMRKLLLQLNAVAQRATPWVEHYEAAAKNA